MTTGFGMTRKRFASWLMWKTTPSRPVSANIQPIGSGAAQRRIVRKSNPKPSDSNISLLARERDVVAGILPAVEPGILPGGKTIRRRPPFSSPASRSSRKSCQNSGSVSAPPRDYPFPLSRISRISRFKFLVFRRLLCSMRSLRLSPIPMGLRPPARGCRASEATPGNPVHGPLQLQRSCALLPFSKPAEARKSKA